MSGSSINPSPSDFAKPLAALRGQLLHPTEYERSITSFLEVFAGDADFIQQSEARQLPALATLLERIAAKMLATELRLECPALFTLKGHNFIHGNAVIEQRALLFFYFPEVNTGIAALIPGAQGGMEVARFQLPGGLPRPELN